MIPIPALRAVPWLALLLPCVLVLLPLGRSAELPIAIAAIVGIVLLARGRLRLDEAGPRLVLVLFACYWLPALLSAFAAVEPGMFGLGPVPAVRQALARAGWEAGSVERVEINEAFAAIAIVVTRELGFPEDIVNVEGGAIAHGHPIGATGAILTTKLIHSMRRDGLKRGIVTLCIGGGQGIALAIEGVR